MLVGVFGNIGDGKTLLTTYLLYQDYLRGKKIYSNYHLKFPSVLVDDLEKILDLSAKENNICFGFDEAWISVDSRRSGSGNNLIWTRFGLQSRKFDVDMYLTAQHIRQIDLRLFNIMDKCYQPSNLRFLVKDSFFTGKEIKELQIAVNEISGIFLTVSVWERDFGGEFEERGDILLILGTDFLNIYDTREIINPVGDEKKESKLF